MEPLKEITLEQFRNAFDEDSPEEEKRNYLLSSANVQIIGDDPNVAIKFGIAEAAELGYNDVIDTLTALIGPFDHTQFFGMSPVNRTFVGYQVETLRHLIGLGYRCNDKALIHDAAADGNPEIIDILIEQGCDVNEVGPVQDTPLSVALELNNPENALHILKLGGTCPDARYLAEKNKMTDVIAYLDMLDNLPEQKGVYP